MPRLLPTCLPRDPSRAARSRSRNPIPRWPWLRSVPLPPTPSSPRRGYSPGWRAHGRCSPGRHAHGPRGAGPALGGADASASSTVLTETALLDAEVGTGALATHEDGDLTA
jgi:hypothetical protein